MGDGKDAAGKRLPGSYITVQQRKPRKILNTVNKKLPFIGTDVKEITRHWNSPKGTSDACKRSEKRNKTQCKKNFCGQLDP